MPEPLRQRIARLDIPLLGTVPADTGWPSSSSVAGRWLKLGDDSPVYLAVAAMMDRLLG